MKSRAEITSRFAQEYARASKKDKGRILDEVVAVTGWNRDHARYRLKAATAPPGTGRTVAVRPRKPRARKYSYDALKVLQRVWAVSGGQCGKYLAVSMPGLLDALERHGELRFGQDRYGPTVRAELLAMSAATIDRYLSSIKAKDAISGVSTTKPSPLLRSAIQIRRAGDEVESEPGFFEGDTVAHCGPTLQGEFARSLNLTDVHCGWVFTHTMRNNARKHVLSALTLAVEHIPFEVIGLDFDNGGEFMNHDVVTWAADRDIFFTRSRPYEKNDQATIESKNNHLVRKTAFYFRYDTEPERRVLNRLWKLANDRMNYLTPTKKPIGWDTDSNGRRTRIYDKPATPLDRLLAAGVISPDQEAQLIAYRDSLNPAKIARDISEHQMLLRKLARAKTEQLYLDTFPKALPDIRNGIHIKAS